MLKLLSPVATESSEYYHRLLKAGIKGGWNYALDHSWLYEEIDRYLKKMKTSPIILDVGCGNSMLHIFLEKKLHLGIIGIDRIDGLCPYSLGRDLRMDMCIDFVTENIFSENSVDIIYWCSSIEHNSQEKMKACVESSMKILKPGGLFLATFSYSPTTYYFRVFT